MYYSFDSPVLQLLSRQIQVWSILLPYPIELTAAREVAERGRTLRIEIDRTVFEFFIWRRQGCQPSIGSNNKSARRS